MNESEIQKKLERAIRAAKKADQLREQIAMDAFDVFRVLKFGKKDLSLAGRRVLERVEKAHAKAGDAREALEDIVWQLEQALKSR